jgi:hypothetical protein
MADFESSPKLLKGRNNYAVNRYGSQDITAAMRHGSTGKKLKDRDMFGQSQRYELGAALHGHQPHGSSGSAFTGLQNVFAGNDYAASTKHHPRP